MSTLPKIGDIVMSPHEKYIENGVTKFDQLDLTTGLTVDENTHPELYDIHKEVSTSEGFDYLVIVNKSSADAFPNYDFTNTSLTDYNNLYQSTYVAGLGAFLQDRSNTAGSITLPLTNISGDLLFKDGAIGIEIRTSSSNSYGNSSMSFKDSGGSEIFNINITQSTGARHICTVTYEGGSFSYTDTWSGNFWFLTFIEDTEEGINFRTRSSDTLGVIPNISLKLVTNYSVSFNYTNGVYGTNQQTNMAVSRYYNKAILEQVVSPNPTTPYRIIADLTEEV